MPEDADIVVSEEEDVLREPASRNFVHARRDRARYVTCHATRSTAPASSSTPAGRDSSGTLNPTSFTAFRSHVHHVQHYRLVRSTQTSSDLLSNFLSRYPLSNFTFRYGPPQFLALPVD